MSTPKNPMDLSAIPGFYISKSCSASDCEGYPCGVTVEKDTSSPTGYTAVFVYQQPASLPELGQIVKVELYSDCFLLFDPEEGEIGSISVNNAISPYFYRPLLAAAGGEASVTCYIEMTPLSEGLWGARLPLSSGGFPYNFRLTDAAGKTKARLDDPANPALTNQATKIRSLSSMVYVPYSPETMGSGRFSDRSLELPRTDGHRGYVETVSYTGADGAEHGLAVYLPYGYDVNRKEPYRVLYLSHGTSGDIYGNELRWLNEGCVANIMDQAIAQGMAEPFVIVTMNNQQYSLGEGMNGPFWDFTKIEVDQLDYIMPYVEAHYHVSRRASGRAYAGLSMGGNTAGNFLLRHASLFDTYGIWSYANVDGSLGNVPGILDEAMQEGLRRIDRPIQLLLAAGKWDFGNPVVKRFADELERLGFSCTRLEVPGAHDWEVWQLIFSYAVTEFFWKEKLA